MTRREQTTRLIQADLQNLLGQSGDPIRDVRQWIRECDGEIMRLRGLVCRESERSRRTKDRLDAKRDDLARWRKRAEEAAAADRDTTARTALSRCLRLEKEIEGLEETWWLAEQNTREYGEDLGALEAKVQEARRSKDYYVARDASRGPNTSAIRIIPESELDRRDATPSSETERIEMEMKRLKGQNRSEEERG